MNLLLTIFTKGGIVLWCFSEGHNYLRDAVNRVLRDVILKERILNYISYDGETFKYRLDNEYDIIVMLVYKSLVQLEYSDKLLDDVHRQFRDIYKNRLQNLDQILTEGPQIFTPFDGIFSGILHQVRPPKIANQQQMIKKLDLKQRNETVKTTRPMTTQANQDNQQPKDNNEDNEEVELQRRRDFFFKRINKTAGSVAGVHGKGKGSKIVTSDAASKQKKNSKKDGGKQARRWGPGGVGGSNEADASQLDYSEQALPPSNPSDISSNISNPVALSLAPNADRFQCGGELPGLGEYVGDDDPKDEDKIRSEDTETGGGGWFSTFRSLVGHGRALTQSDIAPALEKLHETLIARNVAAEPAQKICQSVEQKLEGKVIGTFSRVASIVREAMEDSLVKLLTPNRRVNLLRDVMDARDVAHRPFVIVFCGVNGVGKSTNLAKITYWLNTNQLRVLIAAADTFRAGAVEQLRTHCHHLNSLHPDGVELFEKGYGRDPSDLAAAAIRLAGEHRRDVVLVDTAGRMQDNEPLMRALAKLIHKNHPDLVLFVGEALVGNEAVDQLIKFNQILEDHSPPGEPPRLIDGIVLTKFDTIDDKVGAAVSMTYITGQPIVFVGTGQNYTDLKSLNANAVVKSLLK